MAHVDDCVGAAGVHPSMIDSKVSGSQVQITMEDHYIISSTTGTTANNPSFVTADRLQQCPQRRLLSSPLSMLVPETPIREGESFEKWVFRAHFRYEMCDGFTEYYLC